MPRRIKPQLKYKNITGNNYLYCLNGMKPRNADRKLNQNISNFYIVYETNRS